MIQCFYCEREMDAGRFGGTHGIHSTIDHIIPKSQFGQKNHTNVVNACNNCNYLKGSLSVRAFINVCKNRFKKKLPYKTITVDLYPIIIKNAYKLLGNNSPVNMTPSDKIDFEEATRIIYFIFCRDAKTFLIMMEELLDNSDMPSKAIAPTWYDQYREHLRENKKSRIA